MEKLAQLPGWTEGGNGSLMSADPINGGIIDKCIADGTWFVIFNDLEPSDEDTFFRTRDEAVEFFLWTLAQDRD